MNASLAARYEALRRLPRFAALRRPGTYRSDHLTSKMWILPDGGIVSIDCWHFRWILSNAAVVGRFGLDVASLPDEEDPVRIAAVRAGFFRVNYDLRYGRLTVEGLLDRCHEPIRQALFVLFAENVDQVGWLVITLFTPAVDAISVRHETCWSGTPAAQRDRFLEELISAGPDAGIPAPRGR